MAIETARTAGGTWGILAHLSREDGTGAHRMAERLAASRAPMRDLADALHLLCMLHGAHPGVIDIAAGRATHKLGAEWLARAGQAFVSERGWLIRLAGAVGPLPSTPGQAQTEATISAQRHALVMLAESERTGCASGSAIGLILDWHEIRHVLDRLGERLGLEPPPVTLPDAATMAQVVAGCGLAPGVERALLFGAQQVLAQHHGLWDLIEARAGAREQL